MHPSAAYIRFILARQWGEEAAASSLSVTEELLSMGLLPIVDKAFDRIRAHFNPPEGFKFMNRKQPASVRFMKLQGLHAMWVADEDVKRAVNELVGQKLVTDKIHILLMGDLPSEVIAEKITKKFRINPDITPKMIEAYRHFFWNRLAWGMDEWTEALHTRTSSDALLSSLQCGPQQALFRAGFSPKYDPKQALRDLHRQMAFRIQYLGFAGDTKNTVQLLCQLSREERALYERLYGEGSGLLEQAKEVRRFLMEHRTPNVKDLDKLIEEQGGSRSNDGGEVRQITDGSEEPELEEADGEPDPEPIV